jgi:hypothetical protein
MKTLCLVVICLLVRPPVTKSLETSKQPSYIADMCGWSSMTYTPNPWSQEEPLTEDEVCENEMGEDVFRFGFEEV